MRVYLKRKKEKKNQDKTEQNKECLTYRFDIVLLGIQVHLIADQRRVPEVVGSILQLPNPSKSIRMKCPKLLAHQDPIVFFVLCDPPCAMWRCYD
jgi:hypothetical protein